MIEVWQCSCGMAQIEAAGADSNIRDWWVMQITVELSDNLISEAHTPF